jgi:outer membrane biosynthesis protein TonB
MARARRNDVNNKTTITALILGGYLLGRTKKMKLALTVASALSGSALMRNREQILTTLGQFGESSPELKELQEKITGRLSDAGKGAAQAVVAKGVDQLSTRLQEQTDKLNSSLVPSGDDDEAEEQGQDAPDGDTTEAEAPEADAAESETTDEASDAEEAPDEEPAEEAAEEEPAQEAADESAEPADEAEDDAPAESEAAEGEEDTASAAPKTSRSRAPRKSGSASSSSSSSSGRRSTSSASRGTSSKSSSSGGSTSKGSTSRSSSSRSSSGKGASTSKEGAKK